MICQEDVADGSPWPVSTNFCLDAFSGGFPSAPRQRTCSWGGGPRGAVGLGRSWGYRPCQDWSGNRVAGLGRSEGGWRAQDPEGRVGSRNQTRVSQEPPRLPLPIHSRKRDRGRTLVKSSLWFARPCTPALVCLFPRSGKLPSGSGYKIWTPPWEAGQCGGHKPACECLSGDPFCQTSRRSPEVLTATTARTLEARERGHLEPSHVRMSFPC